MHRAQCARSACHASEFGLATRVHGQKIALGGREASAREADALATEEPSAVVAWLTVHAGSVDLDVGDDHKKHDLLPAQG